jgi:hypothetical protein
MYIKLINGVPENYSIQQLYADNPQTSFPENISDSTLAEYDVYPLQETPQPSYNPITQNLTEGTPEQINGIWTQVWVITDATPEEVASRTADYNAEQKQNRLSAYEQESDPIFFKWQRGEGTQQEWLDAVELVKQQYPYI